MQVHVRFRGESHTLDGDEYGISSKSSDENIKSLISEVFEISPDKFRNHVVDRNPRGIVVRPQAVFG